MTRWPGCALLMIAASLLISCAAAQVKPPVCQPPDPEPPLTADWLNELLRCQEENCAALKALRGEDPMTCPIGRLRPAPRESAGSR